MGMKELQDELARARRICIDTPIFSYHLVEHPRYVDLTTAILRAVEAGRAEGLATTMTLAELLTYPAQKGDMATMQEWELYLTNFPNLLIVPLDQALAREAALVRGETRLKMPDAIQVAAARLHGADAVVTNDRPWAGRVSAPRVLVLEDFVGRPG